MFWLTISFHFWSLWGFFSKKKLTYIFPQMVQHLGTAAPGDVCLVYSRWTSGDTGLVGIQDNFWGWTGQHATLAFIDPLAVLENFSWRHKTRQSVWPTIPTYPRALQTKQKDTRTHLENHFLLLWFLLFPFPSFQGHFICHIIQTNPICIFFCSKLCLFLSCWGNKKPLYSFYNRVKFVQAFEKHVPYVIDHGILKGITINDKMYL